MTSESPEAQMRRACDALMQGDFFTPMADFTPEALNEAMTLGGGLTNITMPLSYRIESAEQVGGDYRYRVVFKLADRDVGASATWRIVDGAWKIASISVDPL